VDESKVLTELEAVSGTLLNSYIEEWRNQGKRVLGYNCSYFPEEIVHAAGIRRIHDQGDPLFPDHMEQGEQGKRR
jgi:benzoyl-CoA reductase/2-hydroxyglutaryl-CoA dehydratase subunit BcrC/BadD/HgdB